MDMVTSYCPDCAEFDDEVDYKSALQPHSLDTTDDLMMTVSMAAEHFSVYLVFRYLFFETKIQIPLNVQLSSELNNNCSSS